MATLIELLKALSDKEAPISTADLAKEFGASKEGTHRWVNLPSFQLSSAGLNYQPAFLTLSPA